MQIALELTFYFCPPPFFFAKMIKNLSKSDKQIKRAKSIFLRQ